MCTRFTGVPYACLSVFSFKQAHVAQLVERILGRDEVTGSNPVAGSKRRIY